MPNPALVASVRALGQTVTGFESVTVRRDFGDGISHFTLATVENPYDQADRSLMLQPGDPVEISLGGQKVISGRVTIRNVAFDAQSHQVVIAGASFTKDVADSSVKIRPGSYDGQTFAQIGNAIVAPHGIGLKFRNPPAVLSTPFKSFSIQYGETGGEVLSRMASMRGVWISDDADGNLVAGQGNPGAGSVAELVEGRNILRAIGKLQDDTAFSEYAAVSQSVGASAMAPPRWYSANAQNPGIRPNRYKLWVAPHPDEPPGLQAHVGRTMAESLWPLVQVTVTVVGWFKPDGTLWEPTDNVTINSLSIFPIAGGDSPTMGIQSVTFAQDSQNGTTTTLECVLSNLLTGVPLGGSSDLPAREATPPSAPQPGTPDYSGGGIST